MNQNQVLSILAIDYGTKRIGVARASSDVGLPQELETVAVNGHELELIKALVEEYKIDTIVVGWPRDINGNETAQTKIVDEFIKSLVDIGCTIVKQYEALTSVEAERELVDAKKPFNKASIDARAAVIILNDYLRTI